MDCTESTSGGLVLNSDGDEAVMCGSQNDDSQQTPRAVCDDTSLAAALITDEDQQALYQQLELAFQSDANNSQLCDDQEEDFTCIDIEEIVKEKIQQRRESFTRQLEFARNFSRNNSSSSTESAFIPMQQPINLCNLPSNILQLIFFYVPAKDLVLNVSRVCHKFYELVDDPILWKSRLFQFYQKPYPVVHIDEDNHDSFNWPEAVVCQEIESDKWKNDKFKTTPYKRGHDGSLHAIWLSRCARFCFTGARDRQVVLWDLAEEKMVSKFMGHSGWIWDVIGLNDDVSRLVSASWDNNIKFWDTESQQCFLGYKLNAAVLAMSQFENRPDVVYYSLYNRQIGLLDCRTPDSSSSRIEISKNDHRRSIISLQSYGDNYLLSGGEDAAIKCFDVRTHQLVMETKLPGTVFCMHCRDEILLAASGRNLYCLEPKTLTVSTVFNSLHDHHVLCAHYSAGCIISGSKDKTVKVVEPCVGGSVMKKLNDHSQCVSRMSYRRGVLVTASTDNTMIAYTPENFTYSNVL